MKILKQFVMITFLFLLIIFGSVFYAFKIEPYRLTLNKIPLNENISNTQAIKIMQIADLHIKEDFTYQNLSNVVNKINAQQPDIVIFTGDLYDNYATYQDDAHIISQLQNIKARYGKIAIWGNRDYGGGAVRQYEYIMEQAGFTLLQNEHLMVPLDNQKHILFTGLDDALMGNPIMPISNEELKADYQVLLLHEPDLLEEYMDYDYDIALSGHSHGGQINIPFLPFINEEAIQVTSLSSTYSKGMYQINEQGVKQLYVSTGIGTTHLSARFGVVPEITLFYLYM